MTIIETAGRITPDEFMQRPDADLYELVDGRLVELHVSRESSRVGLRIGSLFQVAADQAAEPVEVYGSDLVYQCFQDNPEQLRKPDLSVIRLSRLAKVPRDVGYMPIPADLAVEVLSPNDLAYRVSEKVAEYLENGFGTVWVVDPHVRTATVYTPDGPGRVLREQDEIDAGALLPAFRCRVGELFAGSSPPAVPPALR